MTPDTFDTWEVFDNYVLCYGDKYNHNVSVSAVPRHAKTSKDVIFFEKGPVKKNFIDGMEWHQLRNTHSLWRYTLLAYHNKELSTA